MQELNSRLTETMAKQTAAYVVSHYTETGRRLESSAINHTPIAKLVNDSMDSNGGRHIKIVKPKAIRKKRNQRIELETRRLDPDL